MIYLRNDIIITIIKIKEKICWKSLTSEGQRSAIQWINDFHIFFWFLFSIIIGPAITMHFSLYYFMRNGIKLIGGSVGLVALTSPIYNASIDVVYCMRVRVWWILDIIIYWFIIWNQYEIKMRLLIKKIKNLLRLFIKGIFRLLSSVFTLFLFIFFDLFGLGIHLIGLIARDYFFSTVFCIRWFHWINNTNDTPMNRIPNIKYDFVGLFVKMNLNCFVSGFQFIGIRFLNKNKM